MSVSVSDLHAAQYLVEIQASSGPNQFAGGSGYSDYAAYARDALLAGDTQGGPDPTLDPTGYRAFTNGQTINAGYAVATSMKSWIGKASPTGAFSGQYGNRLKFGVRITTTGGAKFGLADVAWTTISVDKDNLVMAGASTGGTLQFSASTSYDGLYFYGIDWGADGVSGGGDDIIYNQGEAGSTVVNELVYFGLSRAWSEDGSGGTDQEKLDLTLDYLHGSTTTATYTIGGEATSAFVVLEKVPEPSSVLLLSLGGVLLLRRQRNL